MTEIRPKNTGQKHNSRKKKSRYFEIYISKVLKHIAPENGITTNAKQQLNSTICIVAKKLASVASRLTQIAKKRTLSEKEVANALKVILEGEIGTNATLEGEKALTSFFQKNQKNLKHRTRQENAGIIFPPSTVEKFLRNFGTVNMMITKKAPIYFAAVLEYIVVDILQLASDMTIEQKRVRITIRDLQLSVNTDIELDKMFRKCGIEFIGGGVVPGIHSSLLMKKPRRKKKVKTEEQKQGITSNKKKHRYRPGVVALREIKKQQRMCNCLIFAKYPFERFTRKIITSYNDQIKVSKDVFIVLQYFIEQYIVKVLHQANSAAIHAGRVKLTPADIFFISELFGYETGTGEMRDSKEMKRIGESVEELRDIGEPTENILSFTSVVKFTDTGEVKIDETESEEETEKESIDE